MDRKEWDNLPLSEKVDRWNEHCERTKSYDKKIHPFNKEEIEKCYDTKMEAARSFNYGVINWEHNYFIVDTDGNTYTLPDKRVEEKMDLEKLFDEKK